jgi:hypothetical protein
VSNLRAKGRLGVFGVQFSVFGGRGPGVRGGGWIWGGGVSFQDRGFEQEETEATEGRSWLEMARMTRIGGESHGWWAVSLDRETGVAQIGDRRRAVIDAGGIELASFS